jgi:phage shock protein C
MENSSRLYRSERNKTIGGVCSGLADYFNLDVSLIRIAFVLLLLFGGGGFLAYIILWIVVPAQPVDFTEADNTQVEDKKEDTTSNNSVESEKKKNNTSLIAGIVLISIGLIILFDKIMPYYNITDFWPVILIVIGALLLKPEIVKSIESKKEQENIVVSETTEEQK